jgi:hypothetical protein
VERINEKDSIEHRCSSKVLGPFRRNGPLPDIEPTRQ